MEHSSSLLKEFEFSEEYIELGRDNAGQYVYGYTGYPKPDHRYKLIFQAFNLALEEVYFWIVEHMKNDQGYPEHNILKVTDVFAAAEHSAFFGNAQQRLGLQQDKVSQFLATIGKMIKELFQLVRELRILDERLGYYEATVSGEKGYESADITLKGIWIDLVEQGAKNPASVYGMSRELQFTTLPDLFFSIHPRFAKDVDEEVEKLDFNRKVKEVLKRKLRTYLEWKEATHKEVKTRKNFTLKYLRQHYTIIEMYISWVKPYLRNIQRLQLAERRESPELIAAFEGSLVEIELLCRKFPVTTELDKPMERNKFIEAVVILTFYYRTKPSMSFSQEYQKGPVHTGLVDISFRAYAWDDATINKYLQMRKKEDMKLLEVVSESVRVAMEAMGGELEKYLKEAGQTIGLSFKEFEKVKDVKEGRKASIGEPFISVLKGAGELFGVSVKKSEKPKVNKQILDNEKDTAKRAAKSAIWQTYKNFKKHEKLLNW